MGDDVLSVREHRFIDNLLIGMGRAEAYRRAYEDYESGDGDIVIKASRVFSKASVKRKYNELMDIVHGEVVDKAIWSREEAVYELKELLRKNKVEAERYEVAYSDEMEIIEKKIGEVEREIYSPDGHLSKKREAELRGELDNLKVARVACNRRHQSNKALNEAILYSVQQLNEMYGYNKVGDDVMKVQAQVIFKDDVPEED